MKHLLEIDKAKTLNNELKKSFSKLKKQDKKKVDQLFHSLHEEEFKKRDCLSCANCCKTTSPIFRKIDIDRIAKKLKMSAFEFESKYLKIDEEHDYVLKTSPCTFLDEQNYCSIYEDRPLACREYPHTDRKNMHQILDLTLKNTLVCPAVANISLKIIELSTKK